MERGRPRRGVQREYGVWRIYAYFPKSMSDEVVSVHLNELARLIDKYSDGEVKLKYCERESTTDVQGFFNGISPTTVDSFDICGLKVSDLRVRTYDPLYADYHYLNRDAFYGAWNEYVKGQEQKPFIFFSMMNIECFDDQTNEERKSYTEEERARRRQTAADFLEQLSNLESNESQEPLPFFPGSEPESNEEVEEPSNDGGKIDEELGEFDENLRF